MSLQTPIKISEQASVIKTALSAWADPRGGSVKSVENLSHLWEELLTCEDIPVLLLCFLGEDVRGDFSDAAQLGRVDRQWQLVVFRGHGFAKGLNSPVGDREAFADSLEAIRDVVRVILNVSAEFPVDYKGMEPLPNVAPTKESNVFMDAMVIRFSTASDLPAVTTQLVNQ